MLEKDLVKLDSLVDYYGTEAVIEEVHNILFNRTKPITWSDLVQKYNERYPNPSNRTNIYRWLECCYLIGDLSRREAAEWMINNCPDTLLREYAQQYLASH